jgi:hypothetical protein
MDQTKITLSEKEMQLVTNADWILTKNSIIKKVKQLLGQLQEKQIEVLRSKLDRLPSPVLKVPPKISKGENYQGLPYLILDHPRVFEKENILAIRTMFWWGHFFSTTLHLSGQYKKTFENKLISAFPQLKENGFFICIQSEQWEHHFEETNYKETGKLSQTEFETGILGSAFIKIAKKTSLKDWDDAEQKLLDHFNAIISWLV